IGGGVVVSVPPAPVASLRDIELLPGLLDRGRSVLIGMVLDVLCEEVTCFGEHIPGAIVLTVSYPDGEIGVDPGARPDAGERSLRRILLKVVASANGDHAGFAGECPIELAKKR